MPAYIIVLRESPLRNPAEYDEYRRKLGEMKGDFKFKPLVAYGAIDALEGEAPDGVVMLEFPTVEDARAWYDNPAYQAAAPHRRNAADWRMVIVEGLPG